jgi:hypothetical protein
VFETFAVQFKTSSAFFMYQSPWTPNNAIETILITLENLPRYSPQNGYSPMSTTLAIKTSD